MSFNSKLVIMDIFLVVTRYMGGVQDCGVFATRSGAEQFACSLGSGGSPEVVSSPVFGDTTALTEVFVGSYYDPILDIHTLEGVYSSYEAAKDAAGERGLVLTRKIES